MFNNLQIKLSYPFSHALRVSYSLPHQKSKPNHFIHVYYINTRVPSMHKMKRRWFSTQCISIPFFPIFKPTNSPIELCSIERPSFQLDHCRPSSNSNVFLHKWLEWYFNTSPALLLHTSLSFHSSFILASFASTRNIGHRKTSLKNMKTLKHGPSSFNHTPPFHPFVAPCHTKRPFPLISHAMPLIWAPASQTHNLLHPSLLGHSIGKVLTIESCAGIGAKTYELGRKIASISSYFRKVYINMNHLLSPTVCCILHCLVTWLEKFLLSKAVTIFVANLMNCVKEMVSTSSNIWNLSINDHII